MTFHPHLLGVYDSMSAVGPAVDKGGKCQIMVHGMHATVKSIL